MHIGLLTPGFSRDADHWAIPFLQNLAMTLAQEHEVDVFSLRYPERGIYRFGGLIHHAMGGGQRGGFYSIIIMAQTVAAIRRVQRQRPFDILHAFWIDEPGLTAVLAGRLIHCPAIANITGGELIYLPDIQYGTYGSAVRRIIVRMALRYADFVVAGSRYQVDMAATTCPKALAPWGVNTEIFTPGPVADWQRPTIIQAASLIGVKDQVLLLEVLALVKRTVPHVHLLLVGNGPLASELQHMAARLGLNGNISWRGTIPFTQMPSLYQQAHLYVQTSRHEAQGMAVLEALACGVPAIGTPVGVLPQVACLPASWDKTVLAEQATTVLTDPATYEQRREVARQTAVDQYSIPIATNTFLQLYHSLSGQSPSLKAIL